MALFIYLFILGVVGIFKNAKRLFDCLMKTTFSSYFPVCLSNPSFPDLDFSFHNQNSIKPQWPGQKKKKTDVIQRLTFQFLLLEYLKELDLICIDICQLYY